PLAACGVWTGSTARMPGSERSGGRTYDDTLRAADDAEAGARMGLRGDACIVGIAERPSERKFSGTPTLSIEQWAGLAADALADAGIDPADVDGIVCCADIAETSLFAPANIAVYCGWSVSISEHMDM